MISERYWRGGIRIGNSFFDAINITFPFVTLIIYSSIIEFRINLLFKIKIITIKICDIKIIKKVNGIFFNGVQIVHSNLDYPKYIVFWSCKYDDIINELEFQLLNFKEQNA